MMTDVLTSPAIDGEPRPAADRPDQQWARPAFALLLVATALLYLWSLGASGWANPYYSAAAQAGSQSWTALFFGSSDTANSITVDKTPASLWVMSPSARIFGVNSWAILVPQALMGVAGVALLYATVRRWFGAAAGLLAGAVLALTPVAVLMFRFNNPDALLVLLLVAAAYATVRATEKASVRWLLPAALILLVAGLLVTRRAERTDRTRAALMLWGGWLLVTGLVFSFMQGIFHAYYTVALAPAIGAIVGIGTVLLWRRHDDVGRYVLAGALAVTAIWTYVLLGRSPDFVPALRVIILIVSLATAAVLAGAAILPRRVVAAVAATALLVGLAGPAAYAVQTASQPHTGAIPAAGPATAMSGAGGGPGGGFGPGFGAGPLAAPPGAPAAPNGGGQPGGGGFLTGSTAGAELVALLQQDADSYTWVAAAVGSNSAAGYQLAGGRPVMAIGGFNGSDPSPTLAEFQQYIADGRIHYFIAGGPGDRGMAADGGSDASQEIAAWVAENFSSTTVDGVMVYDLTE